MVIAYGEGPAEASLASRSGAFPVGDAAEIG